MGLKARLRLWARESPLGEKARLSVLRARVAKHAREFAIAKELPPPKPDTIVLVACMCDERLRLPDFLRHYRELGIGRFALIDTGSIDGSDKVAAEQSDVELFRASGSFAAAQGGRYWINALIRRYGVGRWYVHVDLDEHLVYHDCEHHDFRDLAAYLEERGHWALPAFMLDMYADSPIHRAQHEPSSRLIDVCPFFDGDYEFDERSGLEPQARKRCIRYAGGPRQRLKQFDLQKPPLLAKVPFVKWSADTFYLNPHEITPPDGNFAPVRGCLLHFKFLSDFYERAVLAVERKQHWNDAFEYQKYLTAMESGPELQLTYGGTVQYENSRSVSQAGLISPIDWET